MQGALYVKLTMGIIDQPIPRIIYDLAYIVSHVSVSNLAHTPIPCPCLVGEAFPQQTWQYLIDNNN